MGEPFKNFATVEPIAHDVGHHYAGQRLVGEPPIGAASNSDNT